MPNKYIRHGATYNGDGTTSALATANGGVGAWNGMQVFEGMAPSAMPQAGAGSVAAGDTVFIRSKDELGADITRQWTAAFNVGVAAATSASPVKWIIDGGTVWPGVNGVITYWRNTNFTITLRDFNQFQAEVEDAFVLGCEYAGANQVGFVIIGNGVIGKNIKFDLDRVTYSSNGASAIISGSNYSFTLINPTIDFGNRCHRGVVSPDYGKPVLVNPKITLGSAPFSSLFALSSYGSRLSVYGGYAKGIGAATMVLANMGTSSGSIEMFGFTYPKTAIAYAPGAGYTHADSCNLGMGMDNGLGAVRDQRYGNCDSRTVNNYPTLNATYPDSASTPWSWKIYPNNASSTFLIELPFTKIYTDTAAAKTITVELLVSQSFTAVNAGNLWADVLYTDSATGEAKFVTSCDLASTAALDSSTADWTATTWGVVSCDKRKITLTTPTSIKQDTMLFVVLRGTCKSSTVNDILFVDPDPQLT